MQTDISIIEQVNAINPKVTKSQEHRVSGDTMGQERNLVESLKKWER